MTKILGLTLLLVSSIVTAAETSDARFKRFNTKIETLIKSSFTTKKYPNFAKAPEFLFNLDQDKESKLAGTDLDNNDKFNVSPQARFSVNNVSWDDNAKSPASDFDLKALVSYDLKAPKLRTKINADIKTNVLKVLNRYGASAVVFAPTGLKEAALELTKAGDMKTARSAFIKFLKASSKDPATKETDVLRLFITESITQLEKQEGDELKIDIKEMDFKNEFASLGLTGLVAERFLLSLKKDKAVIEFTLRTEDKAFVKEFGPAFTRFKDELLELSDEKPTKMAEAQLKHYVEELIGDVHAEMTVVKNPKGKDEPAPKKISSLPAPFELLNILLPSSFTGLLPTEASMIRAEQNVR